MEAIQDRLKKMIVERLFMKIAPEDIDGDKSLIDDYGVDSVSLLELVVGLEEEFGIAVDDADFDVEHFKSVSALSAFVQSKLDESGS
jgi:acyl carrier protein